MEIRAMLQEDRGFLYVPVSRESMQRRDAEPSGKIRIHTALKEKLRQLARSCNHRNALNHSGPVRQYQTNDRLMTVFCRGDQSLGIVSQRWVLGQYGPGRLDVAVVSKYRQRT